MGYETTAPTGRFPIVLPSVSDRLPKLSSPSNAWDLWDSLLKRSQCVDAYVRMRSTLLTSFFFVETSGIDQSAKVIGLRGINGSLSLEKKKRYTAITWLPYGNRSIMGRWDTAVLRGYGDRLKRYCDVNGERSVRVTTTGPAVGHSRK